MHRAAILILGSLLLVAALGLAQLLAPRGLARAQWRIAQALHWRRPIPRPLTSREVTTSRLGGLVILLLCAAVLSRMRFDAAFGAAAVAAGDLRPDGNGQLARLLTREVEAERLATPGLVAVSVSGDTESIVILGRSSLRSNAPPGPDTLFELGSLTKVFTATLLAEALESGRVTLETPVGALWPEAAALHDPRIDAIRLGHLATHTAGLPRSPSGSFGARALWKLVVAGDSYGDFDEALLLETLRRHPPTAPAGKVHRYSNVGFGLLGLGLSRAAARPLGELFAAGIAAPLGLEDTRWVEAPLGPRWATGYRATLSLGPLSFGQVASPWTFRPGFAGAGGLQSSPRDMLRILRALTGRTEAPSALRATFAPRFAGDGVEMGLGWFRQSSPSGPLLLWHTGLTGGFGSFIGLSEDGRVGLVLLANTPLSVREAGLRILRRLLADSPHQPQAA